MYQVKIVDLETEELIESLNLSDLEDAIYTLYNLSIQEEMEDNFNIEIHTSMKNELIISMQGFRYNSYLYKRGNK